ncbi:unnamed protein product [Diamesa serratosioi]
MDPLERLPEELCHLIFSHLTVEDILNATKVSKQWNDLIGTSCECMKNIWINVGDRFREPNKLELKIIRSSRRKYENFKISEMESGLQILVYPPRNWLRAQIDIQSFITKEEYINLLKIVSTTIKDLDIFDMEIESNSEENEFLLFQNLCKIRFGFVTSVAIEPFLSFNTKLTTLTLDDISDVSGETRNACETVVELLKLNSNLINLNLTPDVFTKIFSSDNSSYFQFKLKSLIVEYSENTKTILKNFETFLLSQKSLESIVLCDWISIETVEFIFNKVSNIRHLTIDYFDENTLQMEPKTSIINNNLKEMDFDGDGLTPEFIKSFINAAPKLEKLYVFHLTKELLNYISKKLLLLVTLKYCSIEFDCHKYYNKITTTDDCCNKHILMVKKKFRDFRKFD